MIDISISTHRNNEEIEKMEELKELKGIVLYCNASLFTYTEDSSYTLTAQKASFENKFCSNDGFHYVIDEKDIISCVPDNKQTNHLKNGKITYINNAMYEGKANEYSLSVLMLIPEKHIYENIEKKTIKFIANYLIEHELEPKCVMRGFDLNKIGSPLHLLEQSKWHSFIKLLEETYDAIKKDGEDYKDEDLKLAEPIYSDDKVREFYLNNGEKSTEYSQKFEPDNRNIEELLQNSNSEVTTEVNSFTTENKTTFSYAISQNPPSSGEHCDRAYDSLTAKVTPTNSLEVEPIYPDLIVPPGGSITLTNSLSKSNTQPLSNTLSLEELEKREKTFNIKDFADAKKVAEGKPINNNDPYPIDDKIKELESHQPKIKIDEVNFKFHDCNHPGSIIGPAVAKNFAMVQDELITLAKRTERRIVKVENVLATMIRNIFRIGSRMNINCVYYGGQDVYGKYKCIRCLHDDRINDGQSMTLDQCMNCTRYEPILGQVYAILDENATNLSQVLDDIQMSYMTMGEYAQLTRTEEMIKEKEFADIKKNGEIPKTFYDTYPEDIKEGYQMDWTATQLENQRPNIAEYNVEGIEAKKPIREDENQGTIEPEFKETITEEEQYETLIYNSEDYNFNSFGTSYSTTNGLSTDGYFGMGGAQIRNKIVEYAQKAYDLCKEGKAGYSQDKRYSHLDKAINGISYWDCSSLVEGAYKSANISSISGTTYTEFPPCKSTAGGILLHSSQVDKAIAGDIVFMTDQTPMPSIDNIENANINSIYHVGIYIGNDQYIHASTAKGPLTDQIKLSSVSNNSKIFAFGRPKELVEADKQASSSAGEGYWNIDFHKIPSDILSAAMKHCSGQVASTIESMNKYGYKNALIEAANSNGLDPYMVLSIAATESAGDVTNREGYYWGIMQTERANTKATTNLADITYDLNLGCKHYNKLKGYLPKSLQTNIACCIYAYNSGNGTVQGALSGETITAETPGGPLGPIVGKYAHSKYGWSYEEKSQYFAKVLVRYIEFKNKNALD